MHMNEGHKDALFVYAEFYGGIDKPRDVKMVDITSTLMRLLVDGKILEIPFDHTLEDSGDAHQTLRAMMKGSSK